jgi:hypothetical protein
MHAGDLNDPSPPTSSLSVYQAAHPLHPQPSHHQPPVQNRGSGGGAYDFRSPFALAAPNSGSAERPFFSAPLTQGPQQPFQRPSQQQALLGFLNQQSQNQGRVRPATTGSLHLGPSAAFQHQQQSNGPFSGPLPCTAPPSQPARHRRTASSSEGAQAVTSEFAHHNTAPQQPYNQQGLTNCASGASDHRPANMMFTTGPLAGNGNGSVGQGVSDALNTLHRIGLAHNGPNSARSDSLPDVNRLLSKC